MKLGAVIGRVTLSRTLPALIGARWLIVSPFNREHYQRGEQKPSGGGTEPSLVAYDNLGGGVIAGSQKRSGENLLIIAWPQAQLRPAVRDRDRFSVFAGAPGIARLNHWSPRHREQQRDQHDERDGESLQAGTIVTRSPRLSCKSAAARA